MTIPQNISIEYIDKIVFKTENDCKKFKNLLNDNNILSKFSEKIKIDNSYFNN